GKPLGEVTRHVLLGVQIGARHPDLPRAPSTPGSNQTRLQVPSPRRFTPPPPMLRTASAVCETGLSIRAPATPLAACWKPIWPPLNPAPSDGRSPREWPPQMRRYAPYFVPATTL